MISHPQPLPERLPKAATNYGLAGESIVCFAGEDWWYHHPHSKNHILKRLAQQNRVLFVNSITMGLPSASNPDFFLKIRRKLRSYLRWLRKVPEGLFVLTPIALPFYGSPLLRAINRFLLIAQLRLVMWLCDMRQPIVWAAIPSAVDVVDHLGAKLLIYQVSDKYDANEDSVLSRNIIRQMDHELKRRASVVMYSGRKLFEEATEPHRYFLEQAVDFEHFAAVSRDTAAEIASIPRPVLGYLGYIDFMMNIPLIEEVARMRPEWHWVFIGGKSNLVQISAPNVHFLGPKPYSEIPAFVNHFDVCVLPWTLEKAFTSYGSAIKVKEYLATGKPVVISPLYEYADVPGIRVYKTTADFLAQVEDALQNDGDRKRELRQAAVRDCTWDVRTRQVAALITSLMDKGSFLAANAPAASSREVRREPA